MIFFAVYITAHRYTLFLPSHVPEILQMNFICDMYKMTLLKIFIGIVNTFFYQLLAIYFPSDFFLV